MNREFSREFNKEVNRVRIKATNELVRYLVDAGYEFFTSVYLHSKYNEVSSRHLQFSPLVPEVWSDSMFFSVPRKACILRVSLNYQGAVKTSVASTNRDRFILSFRVYAAAKPLEWLNEMAKLAGIEYRTIPFDSCKLDGLQQPLIPVFVSEDAPSGFSIRDHESFFGPEGEASDSWVVGVYGAQQPVDVSQLDMVDAASSLVKWLTPMFPYVRDGHLDIPEKCGLTRDPNFNKAEASFRERMNLRSLREVANFGKFL